MQLQIFKTALEIDPSFYEAQKNLQLLQSANNQ